ncbi:CusA/CzcA family heavy metal efflux RND transporter, partial [Flavobacterium sp. HMWF030]
VALSQLATVEIKNGPNQIQREDTKRRIVVGFNVKDRDVQSIVNELQAKVDKELKLPAGYYVTYGGAFENLNQAKDRLMIAVPVSLILIFILLFFAFNSVKHGLLIYTAIPLSAIGGIFFLALRGMPFSISAGIGFIALFGVAVLNGIVLIAEFNRLKNNGMKNLVKIVLTGTTSRLRPVLMTAFVASLGFLPMALSNGAGAEVQRPLATVVIGGLLVATFLTLFVLPLLYIVFEKGFEIKSLNQKIAFTFVFLSIFSGVNAQQKVSLQTALKMATEKNNSIKNEKLRTAYAQALIKSGADIPKTTVFAEAGQINGAYTDTRFGISQTIAFPTIYKREKQLLSQQWKTAALNTSLKELEIKKAVTQVFYTFLYFKEKEKLLQQADTLFNDFYAKASLRLQKGESNILEKTTAENQRAAIAIQLTQLQQEIQIIILELQVLLNSESTIIPFDKSLKCPLIATSDGIENNILLRISQQQKSNAIAQTQLEKSKYLPDLTIGYFNNSFKGMGPDNNYYDRSDRFSSIQAGLAIPLFTGSQSAKIQASKVGESIAENQHEIQLQILQTQYKQLLTNYKSNTAILQYYEDSGLKNAVLIKQTANRQFSNGEINFLDFVMVINQAIDIQSNYLEAVRALNQNSIELNFITSN